MCHLLGRFCPRPGYAGRTGANQPVKELGRTISGIGSKTFGLEAEQCSVRMSMVFVDATSSELRAGVGSTSTMIACAMSMR